MNQCPWTEFEPDPYPFCEEAICAWVREPANTWTNIAYFVVAFLLFKKRNQHSLFQYYAFAALFLGVGSTLFHMSVAFWAKKLDVMAMFLISSTSVLLSLQKIKNITSKQFFGAYLLINILSYPLIGWGQAGGYLFLFQVLVTIVHEVYLSKKLIMSGLEKKYLSRLVIVFVGSLALSQLDQRGVICDPKNHILTGHGVWHFGTAYCLYLVAEYFSQFFVKQKV